MVTKKSTTKEKASKPEEPQTQKTPPIETPPVPQKESTTTPKLEKLSTPPPLTMKQLHQELETLKQVVGEHAQLIAQLQETLARKRKAVQSNGKVQIKDKQTGSVYPSKNNAYQSLLKSGELKSLVDKGLFGPDPEKNTFGWYTLQREWPDRFEEVPTAQNKE